MLNRFKIHRMKYFNLLLILTTISLVGCREETAEDMLNDYHWRLSNVLDYPEQPLIQPPLLPYFPDKRLRWIEIEPVREGLIDVLAFRHCELLPLIAQRNSSLGKVAAPSQQMIYAIKFFAAVRDCKQQLSRQINPSNEILELQVTLDHLFSIKDKTLDAEVWNGLFGSEEFAINGSVGEQPLPLRDNGSVARSLQALKQLHQITLLLQPPRLWVLPKQLDRIEDDYEALYKNRSGGQIIKSVQLLEGQLLRTSLLIEERLASKPFCREGLHNSDVDILMNIFNRYYVAKVQPWLSYVHKSGEGWFGIQNELINLLPATTAMRDYQEQINQLWESFAEARARHTKAWQTLLTQCNKMPH